VKFDPQADYQQARLTMVRGDLVAAEQLAKAGRDRYSPQNAEWGWKFRILQAEILAYRHLNQEALATLNSPLPADLAAGDEGIRKSMVEGLALARLDRNQEADVRMAAADHLCQRTRSSLDGQLAQTHGVIELGRGNLGGAEAFFRQSLQVARQQKDQLLEATTLLNLGLTALKQEHYDNSVIWSTSAYAAVRSLGAQFAEQKALGNLGWAYYRMGDSDKSVFYFQQAADEAHKLDAKNDLVKWLLALGVVSENLNHIAVAEDYYKQSLALAQQSQNEQDLVDAMTALATISIEQQKWEQADHYIQQAIALCRSRDDRAGELDALLVAGKLAGHRADNTQAEQLFRTVIDDRQSEDSLRWEAQENLAKLYEDEHRPSDAARQYALSLARLQSARAGLHEEELRLPFLANAAHVEDDYIHFLVAQGAVAKALQVADYSRAQTLAEGLRSSSTATGSKYLEAVASPQAVASKIDATILFYWLGPQYSYLWVATPKSLRIVPLPPASAIDALVNQYRQDLQGPRDVLAAANHNGIDLYNLLVAPARHEIEQNSRVIVISDGALDNLNFETLLVSSPALHYLIDDATITNSSALRLLKTASQTPTVKPRLLLIGDPVNPAQDYANLPNAAVEMQSVGSHFPQSDETIFTGPRATNRAYLNSDLPEFSYIHFVAHATASRLSPLDSAVILSRSAPEDDSYKLYARDIVGRPVQAELVTISSCYGAGARAYTGEGLVGLSWAFLRAGAHNVIAALWEASDAATPQLMDRLYTELAKGSSPDVALRAAKLSLLHSDSVFRKPLYWAPFQLYSYQVRPSHLSRATLLSQSHP
jgi:CHAT domain-containing protein